MEYDEEEEEEAAKKKALAMEFRGRRSHAANSEPLDANEREERAMV